MFHLILAITGLMIVKKASHIITEPKILIFVKGVLSRCWLVILTIGLKSIVEVISFSTGYCDCFNLNEFKRDLNTIFKESYFHDALPNIFLFTFKR